MPRPRALASWLVAAAALLAGGAPRASAEGGGPGPPGPKEDPDREEVYPALVSLEPFARSAPAGSEFRLKFRLKSGLRTPVLVVVFPDGNAAYVRPDVSRANEHEIPFLLDRIGGTHRVTLVGYDGSGERVAAKFLVRALSRDGREVDRDVDLPPADTKYPALDPEEHPLRLERFFFHRMNALRRRQGLPALPWHEGVARPARAMLAEAARHWERTFDARLGYGLLLHRVPGAGPGGSEGPSLADRVRVDLAWPIVVPRLPRAVPERGRGNPNYVSESLASADESLERKFEQVFLRKSDLRAPMLSEWTTHAAGAATWRFYGDKASAGESAARDVEPGPPPPGQPRQAFAALVFIQVNDPAAEATLERERAALRAAVAGASTPEERAAAWRRVGQTAFPDAPRTLEEAAGRTKDPVILAGAIDGLWLCAPEAAARLAGPHRLRILQALADEEEFRALPSLRLLAALRYDAAWRRSGAEGLAEVSKRALAVVRAAEGAARGGRPEEALALLEDAKRRFAGFPEEEDVRACLRLVGGAGAPPPR